MPRLELCPFKSRCTFLHIGWDSALPFGVAFAGHYVVWRGLDFPSPRVPARASRDVGDCFRNGGLIYLYFRHRVLMVETAPPR